MAPCAVGFVLSLRKVR